MLQITQSASPEVAAFLAAAETFRTNAEPPLSKASLSSILFGSGRQIERLETGADITTGRLRAAWDRLRDLQNGGPRTRRLSKPAAEDAPTT